MRVTLVNFQVLDGNNVIPPLRLMYITAVLEKADHSLRIPACSPPRLAKQGSPASTGRKAGW